MRLKPRSKAGRKPLPAGTKLIAVTYMLRPIHAAAVRELAARRGMTINKFVRGIIAAAVAETDEHEINTAERPPHARNRKSDPCPF